MSNCQGCGSVLDPTQDEINQAVDDVLVASVKDAKKHAEICPLCGQSQAQPISHRKSVLFFHLLTLIVLVGALGGAYYLRRSTEREAAASQAFTKITLNQQVINLLGKPISIQGPVLGQIKQDETGWHEARISIHLRGPNAVATAQVSGGRASGEPWKFTTLEVTVPTRKKKVNLITGAIIEYDPSAYVNIHTEGEAIPEYVLADVPLPRWDGNYPCVLTVANYAPEIRTCAMPVPMTRFNTESVDHFETDLRTGKFILRQTDLSVQEAGFKIPLTRSYTTQDWLPQNKMHAFGVNSNHPYDIAPLGTRNPYTEQYLVLEDGDFLYFPRVSNGTGYSDAIFRQSEVGNSYYKATVHWTGNGWALQASDGSRIDFPESYNARNLAQGAPIDMIDAAGNKITFIRDPQRNLTMIQAPNGGSIHFTYDNQNRVVRAAASDGNLARYKYDSPGHLTEVSHSDGTARYYFYENGLLTWIRDENKRLLLHNTYANASDWLLSQQFSDGSTIRYRYDLSENKEYSLRTSLTFSNGTEKTIPTAYAVSEVYLRMK